jgi:hypothetical protein
MFPPAKVKFGQWSYKAAFWLCLAQEAESRSRLIKTPDRISERPREAVFFLRSKITKWNLADVRYWQPIHQIFMRD